MTVEIREILAHLERNAGYFPKAAVKEAIARRDEVVPALFRVLEDVARDPQLFASDESRMVHIYAIYLLAQFRETRAYPLLVQIFSVPGECSMDLVGDVATAELGRILASVSGGDIAGMTSLVENEQANEYVRSAALRGLLSLVVSGQRSRDEVMTYFGGLFQTLKQEPSAVWNSLVSCCAHLWPKEVVDDIRWAFANELVESFFIGWETIQRSLAVGKDEALERLKKDYRLIEDTVEEMSWWACFRENKWKSERAVGATVSHSIEKAGGGSVLRNKTTVTFDGDGLPLEQLGRVKETLQSGSPPTVAHAHKIGRNEPCPCGSGKKFKKCCGR